MSYRPLRRLGCTEWKGDPRYHRLMALREDPRVTRFVEAAREFRALIENQALRGGALVRSLLPSVADLYSTALELEHIEIGDIPDLEVSMTNEEWNALFHGLMDRIGPNSCYWTMFDPTQPIQLDDNPVAGNLGDDLADIYRDIIPALKVWNDGGDSVAGGVVDEWRRGFSIHWGNHAVGALRTLHWLEMKAGWGTPHRDVEHD
jgi:uncharacterized protein DUF5063